MRNGYDSAPGDEGMESAIGTEQSGSGYDRLGQYGFDEADYQELQRIGLSRDDIALGLASTNAGERAIFKDYLDKRLQVKLVENQRLIGRLNELVSDQQMRDALLRSSVSTQPSLSVASDTGQRSENFNDKEHVAVLGANPVLRAACGITSLALLGCLANDYAHMHGEPFYAIDLGLKEKLSPAAEPILRWIFKTDSGGSYVKGFAQLFGVKMQDAIFPAYWTVFAAGVATTGAASAYFHKCIQRVRERMGGGSAHVGVETGHNTSSADSIPSQASVESGSLVQAVSPVSMERLLSSGVFSRIDISDLSTYLGVAPDSVSTIQLTDEQVGKVLEYLRAKVTRLEEEQARLRDRLSSVLNQDGVQSGIIEYIDLAATSGSISPVDDDFMPRHQPVASMEMPSQSHGLASEIVGEQSDSASTTEVQVRGSRLIRLLARGASALGFSASTGALAYDVLSNPIAQAESGSGSPLFQRVETFMRNQNDVEEFLRLVFSMNTTSAYYACAGVLGAVSLAGLYKSVSSLVRSR